MSRPPRQDRLTPDTARWLVSSEGRDAIADAEARWRAGEDALALGTALRDSGLDHERAAAAASAGDARTRMPVDLADAGCVFTRAALEQASAPEVSDWRARRFPETRVFDLGCGAGLDASRLASRCGSVLGVDLDEARAVLARHNAAALGLEVHVVVGDAREPPVRLAGAIAHADPSRRDPRGRARRLSEYRPPVGELAHHLAGCRGYGIVVSPAVDLGDPDLPAGELEFIQVGSDLVEAVVWGGELRDPSAQATATLLPDGLTRSRTGEVRELEVAPIGTYLIEVVPAAVRARLHDELGEEIGARRVATRRALLTVDAAPPSSPWWNAWVVEQVLPARPRAVRAWLDTAEEQPLELASSGAELDLHAFWRGLGSPKRGPQGRRLLLLRTDTGTLAVAVRRHDRR